MTLTSSNAGRIDDDLFIVIMSSSSSCKRAVARPRATYNPVTPPSSLLTLKLPVELTVKWKLIMNIILPAVCVVWH
jgi:hypothetical protein